MVITSSPFALRLSLISVEAQYSSSSRFPLLLPRVGVKLGSMSTVAFRWLALACAAGLTACQNELTRPSVSNHVKSEPVSSTHAHTNRLAREKSPYLLQHQY